MADAHRWFGRGLEVIAMSLVLFMIREVAVLKLPDPCWAAPELGDAPGRASQGRKIAA